MALRKTALVILAGLSSLSVACGGTSDGTGSAGGNTTNTPAPGTCDPNDPTIPCFKGKAEPCDTLPNTPYPGNELCLKPPEDGYQLHVGPANYDDPAELKKWELPAGGFPNQGPDVNWCYYMKTPNDQLMYTSEYYAHMRPGSHHYIMFGLPDGTNVPDSTGPGDCADRNLQVAGGANFLSGATREVQNAAMFGDAPEDQGLGSPVPAHQQLNMNLHFVNITDHPVLQEIWVNMINKPADQVTDVVKAMEWLGGLGMAIAPSQHVTLDSSASKCTAPMENTRILGVTAHMHANTLRVSMYKQAVGEAAPSLVFDDFSWSEPTVWRFNSKIQNPAPDRSTSKSGAAMNGIWLTNPGDQFSWQCEVDNKTTTTLTFSDKAYTGEMCNIFGMYSQPKATSPWLCFF